MIGVRIGARAAGCPGRVGLVLGLVVLIAVHLAGTVHASFFEGSHVSAVEAGCAHHGTDGGSGRLAPHPGHDHKADGHIDHAVDRPRTVSADDSSPEPGPDALAMTPVAAPGPVGTGGGAPRDPPGVARSPHGRSALALHCVWRQ